MEESVISFSSSFLVVLLRNKRESIMLQVFLLVQLISAFNCMRIICIRALGYTCILLSHTKLISINTNFIEQSYWLYVFLC